MAEKKLTPVGIAHYPRLNEPDTKYNADGVYHTKLRMDSTDSSVAAFIEWMDAEYDAAYEEAIAEVLDAGKYKTATAARKRVKRAEKPYTYVVDNETGDDTDEILVNFKLPASGTRKDGKRWTMTPKIYLTAALLEEYPDELPQIWGGSKLSVSVTPHHWYTEKFGAGVKLRVEKFFVHELVTSGDDGDDSDVPEGFGKAAAPAKAPAPKASEMDEDYDDDDDDEDGDF